MEEYSCVEIGLWCNVSQTGLDSRQTGVYRQRQIFLPSLTKLAPFSVDAVLPFQCRTGPRQRFIAAIFQWPLNLRAFVAIHFSKIFTEDPGIHPNLFYSTVTVSSPHIPRPQARPVNKWTGPFPNILSMISPSILALLLALSCALFQGVANAQDGGDDAPPDMGTMFGGPDQICTPYSCPKPYVPLAKWPLGITSTGCQGMVS